MARDHKREIGQLEDARAATMKGCQIRRVGIFRRTICRPPQMRAGHNTSRDANQCGDILRSVARSLEQLDGRRKDIAFGGATYPRVSLIDRPVIVKTCMREEGGIKSMVGMMV